MATVTKTREFNVTADKMWDRIGDFYAVHTWMPGLSGVTELRDEKARKVHFTAGGDLVETLLEEGPRFHRYALAIPGASPVSDFEAELRVEEAGADACTVTMKAQFEPTGVSEADAVAEIDKNFGAALESLAATS